MSDRRVRLRRRLLVLGLLPLLLALALSVKVGVMLGLDDRGRSSFADSEFERAAEAFAANGRLNVFEPWVAPYDEGTADYRLADFATARALFEEALLVVPGERECLVRINLSLTLEALGDAGLADSRRDLAEAFWREGIAVLDEGGCRDRDADSDADADVLAEAVAARSVATRLAEKLADRTSAADPQPEDADPPTLEELEQRNEEAQEQRRKNEETRENDPPPDPTPTPTPTSTPTPADPDADPDDPSPPTPSAPPTYSW
jgi:tetratricopeptide (TPR) repeat protein